MNADNPRTFNHAPKPSGSPAADLPRRVTIKDVARRVGTSPATVSAVLSGRRGNIRVGIETAERIRSVAHEMGYRRNELAASLSSRRTGVLGVVFSYREAYWDGNPFNVQVMNGVAEAAAQHGFQLMMYTQLDHAWGQLEAGAILDGRADGAIVVTPPTRTTLLHDLVAAKFPIVAVCCEPDAPVPHVNADDFGGSAAATEHLLELGHTRLGMLAGPRELAPTEPRMDGFLTVMDAAGLPVDPALLRHHSPDVEGGYRGGVQMLGRADRPTALLTCHDLAARGAMEAARHLGLTVPEDVSIVGFDDADFAAWLDPPLTTVAYPARDMAWQAADLLVQLIQSGSRAAASMVLPTRLVARRSSAPPPADRLRG